MYKVTDKKGLKYTRNGRVVTLREGDVVPQKDLEKGCIKKEWLAGLVGSKRLEEVKQVSVKPKTPAKPKTLAKGGNPDTTSKGSPIVPDDKKHPGGDKKQPTADIKHPEGAGGDGKQPVAEHPDASTKHPKGAAGEGEQGTLLKD